MKTLSDDKMKNEQKQYSNININELLEQGRKIVTFIGCSESGTSFIINNLAELLAIKGLNVAVLDATKNKSSYYIYTKNEEELQKIAINSMENLSNGIAKGIKVNENMTVYTAMPGNSKFLENASLILETLVRNHTLVLVDCDFETPVEYFEYSQNIFLVQTMNMLKIQPFTEILARLEDKGALDIRKLKIIINKYIKIPGITEKEIIGALAFYNEPTKSYMKQLFNKETIEYMVIPFDQANYIKYLQRVSNSSKLSIRDYSTDLINLLEQLGDNIYPFIQ